MTDNKGDLISREALKEDFKSRLVGCNEWIEKAKDKETKIRASAVKSFIGEVIMTIDNAPTVEPCKDCEDRKQAEYIRHSSSWHELQALRKFKEEHDRPQGKWQPNYTSQFFNPGRSCSICGKIVEFSENYCPQCGAYMRGEEHD